MKKSTYYFSHDYNAASDAKILFLRQQLGMEGYGIYWFILEQLVQAGGYLPLKIIPVLAMQCQTQEIKLKAVVADFDLFVINDGCFFSTRLNEHLELRKLLSEKGKTGALSRWKNGGAIGDAIAPANGEGNAKERKLKEIKGKEIKGKEIIDPFGFGGLDLWKGWVDYKKEEHRESYKSEKTEQAAINQLYQLSGGDLAAAKKIIEQSIANRWKGLFQLKNTNNGTSKAEQLTADVQEAFNRRFGQV